MANSEPQLSAQERLLRQRSFTETWGTVTPEQQLQLRMWGPIVLAGYQVTATVDADGWLVTFEASHPADTKPEIPAGIALEKLAENVRWLLGGGWDVEVVCRQDRWTARIPGDEKWRRRTIKR